MAGEPPAPPGPPSPAPPPRGQIGVDQWVAQSGERRDVGTGWRARAWRVNERIGWWPKLATAVLAGYAFSLLTENANFLNVGFNALLYAIFAMGLNIAVGWAGLLDLGFIAFVGFGSYGYAVLSSTATGSGGLGGTHLAALESIPIVMVCAGVVGVIIGLIALRLEGDYLAIVTLFVGQAFMIAVNNIDSQTLGGVNGIFGIDSLHGLGGDVTSPNDYYVVALIVAALVAAVLHLLHTSRTGRAWRALKDDPLAAQAMTMPINKLKVMAYSFSAMVGALGGALFAAQNTSVFPTNFTANILILIYACLVLGGVGSIAGAITGGVVVTVMEQMLSSPKDSAYLFYGIVLIALIWKVRPWRYLGAVLAAIVGFGFAAHGIVGAISSTATAGNSGSGGWIGSAVKNWVIVPSNASSYGNILFVVVICMVVAIVQLRGWRRLALVVPTVYLGACCWESRLSVNPSITTQIMIGAILIVTMAARPNGLLGKRQVEVL
jgi:branched-chain amino acid transport system permease protein